MMRYALVIAIVLAVTNAHAAVKFATGFEFGTYPKGDSKLYIFDAESATPPTIETTPTPRGKFCAYGVGTTKRGKACTTNADCDTLCVDPGEPDNDFSLCIDGPAADTMNLVQHKMGSAVGCFAQLTRVSATQFNIEVYFEDTGTECKSASNNGTECTTDAECFSETVGEPECGSSEFAIGADTLTEDRWYEIVLDNTNRLTGLSDAACGLWEGAVDQGQQSRPQGECLDTFGTGPAYAWACTNNGDCNDACGVTNSDPACCPSGCVCLTTSVGNITDVRLGDTETIDIGSSHLPIGLEYHTHLLFHVVTVGATGGANWRVCVDDVVIDDADGARYAAMRIADLQPNGAITNQISGQTGCTGTTHYDCMNELDGGGTLDVNSFLNQSTTTRQTSIFDMENITLNAADLDDPTSQVFEGVALTIAGIDSATGGGSNQNIEACITDAVANQVCPAAKTDMALEGTGVFANYNLVVDANYNSTTEINGARYMAAIDLNGCVSSCGTKVFTAEAELIVKMDVPPLPNIAQDVNGDGVKRLTVIADSVGDDFDFKLANRFEDFNSIIACTKGSTTIGDVENQIESILDGTLGGRMTCEIKRGVAGKPDYILLFGMAANTLANTGVSWPAQDTTKPTGTCRGGANHGLGCSCPKNSGWRTSGVFKRYCLNNTNSGGANWLSSSINAATCRACTTKSDCGTNIPCTSNTDCNVGSTEECDTGLGECVIGCTASLCNVGTGLAFMNTKPRSTPQGAWLDVGCINTQGCPDGLCMGPQTIAEYERSLKVILAAARARAGASKVEVIYATEPTSVPSSGVFTGFSAHDDRLEHAATIGLQHIIGTTDHWVDTNKWVSEKCRAHDRRNCMRDGIHLTRCGDGSTCTTDADCTSPCKCNSGICSDETSGALPDWTPLDTGVDHALDSWEACLENLSGTSDGTCVSGICSTGKVGSWCATASDCHLYDCGF